MASTASTASTKKTSTALKAPGKGSTAVSKTTPKAASTLRETTIVKEQKLKPEKPMVVAPTQALKPPLAEKPATKRPAARAESPITPEERQRMIRDAAYYKAEQRGFVGGDPHQDWLDAEYEIDQQLMKRS